ncbi:hypothetical protein ATANTOWER_012307 [Ataeniobius toweri]|uniref:Uncharacterized protein n=1 Tax=Ataeniobius toweri TaxID=208326 RepID=A0ABU7ATN2_9TELE|nr:hypothetical protein [Ataeniobius toweri]
MHSRYRSQITQIDKNFQILGFLVERKKPCSSLHYPLWFTVFCLNTHRNCLWFSPLYSFCEVSLLLIWLLLPGPAACTPSDLRTIIHLPVHRQRSFVLSSPRTSRTSSEPTLFTANLPTSTPADILIYSPGSSPSPSTVSFSLNFDSAHIHNLISCNNHLPLLSAILEQAPKFSRNISFFYYNKSFKMASVVLSCCPHQGLTMYPKNYAAVGSRNFVTDSELKVELYSSRILNISHSFNSPRILLQASLIFYLVAVPFLCYV